MSAALLGWVESLEKREAARSGQPVREARVRLANRIGVMPGTLENIRRKRVKEARVGVFEKVRRAFIRSLEDEIAALTHELQMARQCGVDPREDEVARIEAAIAQALTLIADKHSSVD